VLEIAAVTTTDYQVLAAEIAYPEALYVVVVVVVLVALVAALKTEF
jgi:hypothetical protein